MTGYLLTLLGILLSAAIAFWWIRRGYRSQRRMRNEIAFAKEKLLNSTRQLTADLHQSLEDLEDKEVPSLRMEAALGLFATDRQDGTLYALVPFNRTPLNQKKEESDLKYAFILLARWRNGRWVGTPIHHQGCSVREALLHHSNSLLEVI